jgi:alpha/beta superfamily hydrolase
MPTRGDTVDRFGLDPLRLAREEPAVFKGPSGGLEGLWRPVPAGQVARGSLVVAHPHPAFGGTLLNKVVFHTARVLNHELDLAALRFNFRGVGRSDGVHEQGATEEADVRAAWAEARRRLPDRPLVAAGFSFGAAMTLRAAAAAAGAGHPLPAALVLLGTPGSRFPPPDPFPAPIPAVAVHGERDAFTPPEAVGAYLERWPGPVAFHVEPGADHFLEGRLPEALAFVVRTLDGWL